VQKVARVVEPGRVVAQVGLVEDGAVALPGDVGDPDAPDLEALLGEEVDEVLP